MNSPVDILEANFYILHSVQADTRRIIQADKRFKQTLEESSQYPSAWEETKVARCVNSNGNPI